MEASMSTGGSQESPENSSRRERAAVAAQACQTCRNRKSRCDEQRPKCGLCTRLNVECVYREPLPTKKDKTMVHILDALNRLENKFDNFAISGRETPETRKSISQTSTNAKGTPYENESSQDFPNELQKAYQHLTAAHKVVLWPSIYIHMINSGIQAAIDLQHVLQDGTPWLLALEMKKHPDPLPSEPRLPYFAINARSHEQGFSSDVHFPSLTIQHIHERCEAYFSTFNILLPVLNRDSFMNDIVAPLLREGYKDGDNRAVLALLVFALGEVALDGVFQRPISSSNGHQSGFRGGTPETPPGLASFNEARRRSGFVSTMTTLENVQIHLLEATYYESNARHLEFWRCSVAASMSCQVLIRCDQPDWTSVHGDLIRRAYWACMLNEDLYHMDLDLPSTGIASLQDDVGLPYFHEASDQQNQSIPLPEGRSHFQYHFLALISLRRLISTINKMIHNSTQQTEQQEDYGGPPVHVIRELERQLESWRGLLPRPLQWNDQDRFEFPPSNDPGGRRPNEAMFSHDQNAVPINHRYNLDIVSAQLRTRFYYARFMTYRPFVYKALHFPELMTTEDVKYCALAVKSACLWPICMAPPKNKKRLVPHLFAWTQNFMGILLILRMTTENDNLRRICESHVNQEEVQKTVMLLLEWMGDVKQLCGIAEWSCRILEPLYPNGLL